MFFSTCCVQDEWAVCRVFNKDLAAKPAHHQITPATPLPADDDGMTIKRTDSLSFIVDDLLDIANLPPLTDDHIDFKGASTSGGAMAAAGVSYQQVIKTEQPMPQANPNCGYLFSMPATSNNTGGGGYSQEPPPPIRTTTAASRPLFPAELDDLWGPDAYIDYSNMLK